MMGFPLDHWLPLIFMAIMGLALLAYVLLDGYDLGVGMLLPFATTQEKNVMVSSIGPFWDANETWLVLGIGILLICFPKANSVVLGHLYLPVAAMLIGIVLRGVAFDFRVKARDQHKELWNRLFAGGSLVTTLAQGWMIGAWITGFEPGWRGMAFSLGIAITLPATYGMLGVGWLLMKTQGELQQKAVGWGTKLLWPMGATLVGLSLATPLVNQAVFDKWFGLPQLFYMAPVPLLCAGAFLMIRHVLRTPGAAASKRGWWVYGAMASIIVLAFMGLAYSIFPYLVIGEMTVWQAASATESLVVIGIGVAITLPVIIVYTIFMYRVFWGKAEELTYGL